MKRRQKASEVYAATPFLFAKTGTFEGAYPTVANVKIEVEEEGDGVYQHDPGKPYEPGRHFLDRTNMAPLVDCSNPICFNGGLSIKALLDYAVMSGKTTIEESRTCQGYEGSPKGRKNYRPCANHFRVKGTITYKKERHGKKP